MLLAYLVTYLSYQPTPWKALLMPPRLSGYLGWNLGPTIIAKLPLASVDISAWSTISLTCPDEALLLAPSNSEMRQWNYSQPERSQKGMSPNRLHYFTSRFNVHKSEQVSEAFFRVSHSRHLQGHGFITCVYSSYLEIDFKTVLKMTVQFSYSIINPNEWLTGSPFYFE